VSEYLFVSDLHLDATRPAATLAFLRFLRTEARHAACLYILGDLFEFWIGDDAAASPAPEVLDALRDYVTAGGRCQVMRGNRDFLLGAGFTARTGAAVLADQTVVDLHGEQALLMHGDLLCTDDVAYQRYRRRVHNRTAQRLFLALPRSLRQLAGDIGRRRSQRYTAGQPPTIMDVNPAAVTAALRAASCRVLIHGHTHRPAIHALQLNEQRCERIVLGDWYEQGSVLSWSASRRELRTLAFT
jgi:UDP-2,3-diacylglucosamine hydrolase